MKTLKVDDKWEIGYDPENNDRPLFVRRYDKTFHGWDYDNAVTAMFYALLAKETEIQELRELAHS